MLKVKCPPNHLIEGKIMKNSKPSPWILTVGTTLASGFISTSVIAENFDTQVNLFIMTELSGGYKQLAQADDTEINDKKLGKMKAGVCGEGKCGGAMMSGNEEKMVEGQCAGNKPMPKTDKDREGKCGINKTKI
jgi:uncharacterized low-complexity protein